MVSETDLGGQRSLPDDESSMVRARLAVIVSSMHTKIVSRRRFLWRRSILAKIIICKDVKDKSCRLQSVEAPHSLLHSQLPRQKSACSSPHRSLRSLASSLLAALLTLARSEPCVASHQHIHPGTNVSSFPLRNIVPSARVPSNYVPLSTSKDYARTSSTRTEAARTSTPA